MMTYIVETLRSARNALPQPEEYEPASRGEGIRQSGPGKPWQGYMLHDPSSASLSAGTRSPVSFAVPVWLKERKDGDAAAREVDSFRWMTFTGTRTTIFNPAEYTSRRNVQTIQGGGAAVKAILFAALSPDPEPKPDRPAEVNFGGT